MEIAEMQKKKDDVEKVLLSNISLFVDRFQTETNCKITGVRVSGDTISTVGEPDKWVPAKVELEVKL